jgi:outer membrane protein assembly factor BamB
MQTPAGTLPPRTEFTPQAPLRLTFRDRPKLPPPFRRHVMSVLAGSLATVVTVAVVISQIDWDGATGNLTDGLLDGVESLGDGIENQGATGPQLALVHEQQLNAGGATAVTAAEGMALLADVVEGETTIDAISPAGEQLWTRSLELEPTDLFLTVVEDLLIVDATASATNAGEDMRAALALADGALLWQQPWTDRTDLAFYGTDAVVDQHPGMDDNALVRVDLTTGEEQWSNDGSEGEYPDYRFRAATAWDDGKGAGTIPPNSHSLFDNLAAGDKIVELEPREGTGSVRDAADGSVAVSGDLPLDEDVWTVFDDLIVGLANDEASPGRDTLIAYSLADLGEAWRIELDVSYSVQNVKACGPHLVCAALDHSDAHDQYKTVAYDTATGEQRWEVAVDWATDDHWYTSPSGLVHGDQAFDTVHTAKVIDFEGGIVLGDGEPLDSVLAVRQDRAVVEGYGNGFEVSVLDMATGTTTAGQAVGADVPEHASLAGDLLVVLTGDMRAIVYTIPALD